METTAYLSNSGDFTSFTYGDVCLRFRAPHNLLHYDRVKTWDKGYIVVDTTYDNVGQVEEYIDLVPILENLRLDPMTFLHPIRDVQVRYGKGDHVI